MLSSLPSFGGQIIGQNRDVFKSCNSLYNKQDRVFRNDNRKAAIEAVEVIRECFVELRNSIEVQDVETRPK